jgi:protein phosphatase
MFVIGGRTNNVCEQLPLEVFDTETSDWTGFNSLQRFRCGTWVHENFINIYGGFDLATPNVPTDSIYRINLGSLFSGNQNLKSKLLTISVGKKSLDSSS